MINFFFRRLLKSCRRINKFIAANFIFYECDFSNQCLKISQKCFIKDLIFLFFFVRFFMIDVAGKQDPPIRGAGHEPVPSRRSI